MIDRTEIALRTGTNLWIPGLLIAIVVSLAIIIICTRYPSSHRIGNQTLILIPIPIPAPSRCRRCLWPFFS